MNTQEKYARTEAQTDEHSLSISIDGETLSISIEQLGNAHFTSELESRIRESVAVRLPLVEPLLTLPEEARTSLLEIYSETRECWKVGDGEDSLFDAVLKLRLDGNDLARVSAITRLAMAAAAIEFPDESMESASRIREWRKRFQLKSEHPATMAKEIRNRVTAVSDNEPDSPQELAKCVLQGMQAERTSRGESFDSPPLIFHGGEFHVWDGHRWIVKRDSDFRIELTARLQSVPHPPKLTSNFIGSVVENITAMTRLDTGDARLPVRLDFSTSPPSVTECQALTVANGLLDLADLETLSGPPQLRPSSPSVFGAPHLPVAYDPNAKCPLFQQTLGEILTPQTAGDMRFAIVQELAGYCLLTSNFQFEKAFVFLGDGANGKSLLLKVLRAMLGEANVSGLGLDLIGERFTLAETVGKLAIFGSDLPRLDKINEGRLKQLTSGEPLQLERKYHDAQTVVPTAKLVFATNHLPPFSDTSEGIWRRLIIVPFDRRFEEHEMDRTRAATIISTELPGVLYCALEGAWRLLRQNGFSSCSVCAQALVEHRFNSDPVRQFLDERCNQGHGLECHVDTLYFAYKRFCSECGKQPKAKPAFTDDLERLGIAKERKTTGDRKYNYLGVEVLPQYVTVPLFK